MESLGVMNGKKVLITGHTGFKGSWLSIWLIKLGANVLGVSLDPLTSEDNFVVSGLSDKINDVRADIRDLDKLQKIFNNFKPEIVFHLAAQPIVKLSYEKPIETYEVNVMGTLNVLECIRNTDSVKVGIMITTDKCYENHEQLWGYRECDPMGGYDPYSSSKACAELLISSYRNSFINPKDYGIHGKAISSVRAGNVIGGGDWQKNRLIPDCIRSFRNNSPIEIRNPSAVRPWQYVLEPLCGYILLAANMYKSGIKYSGAWNFGPDLESVINVKTLVEKIASIWGGQSPINIYNNNTHHEANLLNLDCTKAKINLGWKPMLTIDQALVYTIDWYKNYENIKPYEICISQINDYEKIMEGLKI